MARLLALIWLLDVASALVNEAIGHVIAICIIWGVACVVPSTKGGTAVFSSEEYEGAQMILNK